MLGECSLIHESHFKEVWKLKYWLVLFLWKKNIKEWNKNLLKDVVVRQMRLVKNSERIFVMLFVLSVLDLIGKVSKKNGSFWEISPKSVYPPKGFCEIWENERWNSGRKRRFSGWFGGVSRGLDLVWESATPPTHIWERSPQKNGVFFYTFP